MSTATVLAQNPRLSFPHTRAAASAAATHRRLAAFPPSPFLSLASAPARARRTRANLFLPHLVAAMEDVEETYIMVKPDGVQRGLVGEIISRFEKKGFLLKGLKLFRCPTELAEEHYKDLKEKSFFPKLIDYVTSGPVVCMAWEGVGVVASARKLIGATNPLQAEPGTIRGDLAVQTGRNVVHGSDSPDNGQREIDFVKTLVKFRSRHNFIRVLDVSRRANHPLAGSRLLLLDSPGNIHSLSFLFDPLTSTYFDVFATLPPLLPPGPLAILGFGAGTAARIILHLFPNTQIHGWELDPSVISVAREYFGLAKLEKQNPKSLSIYIGDALTAEIRDGFAGILVDLFSKGSLIPELQEAATWEMLKRRLRRGGRIMVNCGGSCVEAEDESRDGEVVMVETLKTMREVFAEEMFVLNLGHRREDSCVALTGPAPDVGAWKEALPVALRGYVHQWSAFNG